MRKYAIIRDNTVANVICVADDAPLPTGMIDVTDTKPRPGPGWSFDKGSFTAPASVPASVPPAEPVKTQIDLIGEKIDALVKELETAGVIPAGSVSAKVGIK